MQKLGGEPLVVRTMNKVEIDLDELKEILYLVEKAYIKQSYSEYYEVLDLLYEIKERLEKLVGEEQ